MSHAAPARIGMIIGQLSVGGAEGQLFELLRGIDRERFMPMVYSLAEGEGALLSRIESTGAQVRVIGSVGFERVRLLRRAVAEDGVRLVHAWLFIANSYAWMTRMMGTRVPLITSARNCKSQGKLHHLLNMAAFRQSERIIVNSEQVRDYVVRAYRAPASRIQVVYNGVDTERFEPATRNGHSGVSVLAAGRLVAQKNFGLFLEAAARIHRELPDVRFRIAGEGPQRGRLAEQAQSLGLNGTVEFLGERGDMNELFQHAAVFWLTSSWEGLPNVVIEAMASGLPVVATDVGGTRELFTSGREGFLVRSGSIEDFTYFGAALLRDEALRERMGAAARRRAQQFATRRMVQAMESVYDSVLREAA